MSKSYPMTGNLSKLDAFKVNVDRQIQRAADWLTDPTPVIPDLKIKRVGGNTFIKFGRLSCQFVIRSKETVAREAEREANVDLSKGRLAKRYNTFIR